MSDNRPLLLWDIDDTLNRQIEIFMEHSPLGAGKAYRDVVRNPQYLALGCSKEEYLPELDRCRREFLYNSEPRPEMLEFFREYGHTFRSMTLSSVPITLAPLSAAWLLRHFGAWIQGTLYVPSERKNVQIFSHTFRSKAEAVTALNGILIDDTECTGLAGYFGLNKGAASIMLHNYPVSSGVHRLRVCAQTYDGNQTWTDMTFDTDDLEIIG